MHVCTQFPSPGHNSPGFQSENGDAYLVGNHRCSEFMSAIAMMCPKDSSSCSRGLGSLMVPYKYIWVLGHLGDYTIFVVQEVRKKGRKDIK
ncbi:hypothetical protein STEG23_024458 [Scotinomys teguina]